MPKRIQRKRTKGWRMPENTVYVGRPSKYANPYKVGQRWLSVDTYIDMTQEMVVEWFEVFAQGMVSNGLWTLQEIRNDLRGNNLACWCPLDKPCHADILLKLANE